MSYKVALIGAGTMGSGIAQKLAQEGLDVYLVDISEDAVSNGLNTMDEMLSQGVERGVFTEGVKQETLNRVTTTTDYGDLKDVDFVIEAVFEDKDIKRQVHQQLDEVLKPEAVISSNTSSYYITNLAKNTNRPDRFLGMHYFFHPAKNRLLEIIPHEGTSEETIEKAQQLSALHNKTDILVQQDAPGFIVNRFFVPWLNESTRIVEDGIANKATVDQAAEEAFEIGMGPFALMNASGIPIAYHSAITLSEEISEFYKPTKMLKDQVDSEELWEIVSEVDRSKFEEISEHLLATTIGVAAALVDEGVATIEDADRGAMVGLRWKKGPFQLANEYGVENVYEMVQNLNKKRPGFKVANILKEHAEANQPFEFQYVDLTIENNIAYIYINRPEAMNALNPLTVNQLEEKFEEAQNNPDVKGIAFRGPGKAFVAGADIKFFVESIKDNNIDAVYDFTSGGQDLFRRIETSEKPTIAVVDGLSLGGGSELALANQGIVATEQASFAFPESGLGIFPGLGGMIRTGNMLNKELAKYFVLTGKTINAQQAKELGIITRLVQPTEIEQNVEDLVEQGIKDKYEQGNETPEEYKQVEIAFADENIQKIIVGNSIDGVDEKFVEKTSKKISRKGPNAVETILNIMDEQENLSIDNGIKLELSKLKEIFSTEEALIGLEASLSGERPDFSKAQKIK